MSRLRMASLVMAKPVATDSRIATMIIIWTPCGGIAMLDIEANNSCVGLEIPRKS